MSKARSVKPEATAGVVTDHSGALAEYARKRDPDATPEPFAGLAQFRPSPQEGGVFVVQQHAARRLHWDLRLEIGGALASWAIPRGPTLDAKEKRLAVQTEDHPIEYAQFEGIIPDGNYGAGAMIVWDRGVYTTVDGTSTERGRASGKLDLEMSGHKLRGRWALVRIKGGSGKDWLLLYKGAPLAGIASLVDAFPHSIVSGLTVEELREGGDRTEALAQAAAAAGARLASLDRRDLKPMLAVANEDAFSDPKWIFELKHDGVRCLAERRLDGTVRLYSRNGLDLHSVFPEIATSIGSLPCTQFVLDGEIVALDEHGRSSFERLQQRLHLRDPGAAAAAALSAPTVMFTFDMLALAGYDVRGLPLLLRKQLLQQLAPKVGMVRFADHIVGEGEAFYEAAVELGLEGMVAKLADSPYQSGRRSKHWLKVKAPKHGDFVVVGYLAGKGSRGRLGSLLLAARDRDGALHYVGNVGSGLTSALIDELLAEMEPKRIKQARCSYPAELTGAITWVEPELVVEVSFTEMTSAGMLRHPVFVGLRSDKSIDECDHLPEAEVAPVEEAVPVANERVVRVVNRDKIFWPQDGYTKGDLLDYYEAVWPWLEPHLTDRPVVLTRYPDGIEGKNFFQKNAPAFTPDWMQRFRHEDSEYFICNDLESLLYVINSACIPLHVWSARRTAPDRPDWLIIDLDPKTAPFAHVVQIALHTRKLLADIGLPCGIKTSGQDGLHVLVPLNGELTHNESKTCADLLARTIASECPDIATTARALQGRGGKVYIDAFQNGLGKTIASAYSVRARPHAPVSAPLAWTEVNDKLRPLDFTIKTLPARLGKRRDPLRKALAAEANVVEALERLVERMR